MKDEKIRKRISIIDDYCEAGYEIDNPSYYFCQVYADENQEKEIDYFCIHKKDVEDINNDMQVEKYAINTAKEILEIYYK